MSTFSLLHVETHSGMKWMKSGKTVVFHSRTSLFITSAIAIDVSVSLVLFTTAARTLYHTFKTVGPTQQSFVSLKSEQA